MVADTPTQVSSRLAHSTAHLTTGLRPCITLLYDGPSLRLSKQSRTTIPPFPLNYPSPSDDPSPDATTPTFAIHDDKPCRVTASLRESKPIDYPALWLNRITPLLSDRSSPVSPCTARRSTTSHLSPRAPLCKLRASPRSTTAHPSAGPSLRRAFPCHRRSYLPVTTTPLCSSRIRPAIATCRLGTVLNQSDGPSLAGSSPHATGQIDWTN